MAIAYRQGSGLVKQKAAQEHLMPPSAQALHAVRLKECSQGHAFPPVPLAPPSTESLHKAAFFSSKKPEDNLAGVTV